MKFNSIRFKISILYVMILGAILVVYSVFLYAGLHYTLYDELDDELKNKAQEIAYTINSYLGVLDYGIQSFDFAVERTINIDEEGPGQDKIKELHQQWLQKVDKLDLKEDFIVFLNANGEPVVSSNNLKERLPPLSPGDIAKLREGKTIFKSIKFEKRSLRMISTPFSFMDKELYVIQVWTSLKPIIRLLHVRLWHIIVTIPIILLSTGFIGQIFAVRILRPAMEITKTAKNITHENLSARVKTEHIDEEMKYLADAFNDMIARLEKSFQYIAEFSSHVAHELKTPLAIMRGESEVALRKERSPEEYKKAIKVNLEETERMCKTVEDLLLLTRLDYGTEVLKSGQFDLAEFMKEIYEQSKILASQKNITVNLRISCEPIKVNGNRLHLRRLFFNLVDNAVKFTPKDGRIEISVGKEDKKVAVSISDTGCGISDEDIPKIFKRFYRVHRKDQTGEHSAGLGLSIALSIARMHEGDIKVKSTLGKGSVFTVALPLIKS